MSDLSNYFAKQVDTKLALQQYATAGKSIELCQIKECRAECLSQHLPLGEYQDRVLTRDELMNLIDYVVFKKITKIPVLSEGR